MTLQMAIKVVESKMYILPDFLLKNKTNNNKQTNKQKNK
jgi:hypothetical protein